VKLQSLIQYRTALRTTAACAVSYRTTNAKKFEDAFKVEIFLTSS